MAFLTQVPILSLRDVSDASSLLLRGDGAVLGVDEGIRQLRDLLLQVGEARQQRTKRVEKLEEGS